MCWMECKKGRAVKKRCALCITHDDEKAVVKATTSSGSRTGTLPGMLAFAEYALPHRRGLLAARDRATRLRVGARGPGSGRLHSRLQDSLIQLLETAGLANPFQRDNGSWEDPIQASNISTRNATFKCLLHSCLLQRCRRRVRR